MRHGEYDRRRGWWRTLARYRRLGLQYMAYYPNVRRRKPLWSAPVRIVERPASDGDAIPGWPEWLTEAL